MRVMKSIEKQKLCPNCEGRIPVEMEICPYCAHELAQQGAKPQNPLFHKQSLEESLASLYKPPYQGKKAAEEMSMEKPKPLKGVEASLYGSSPREEEETQAQEKKSSLWPTVLLLLAANLLLLGILQLLFGVDGVVHLEWDTSNWFFYCLASIPLFYFGWKKLQEID
jgi:hypothetical protein